MSVKIETQELMRIFVHGKAYAQTRARHGANGAVYSNATPGLKRWKAELKREFLGAQRLGAPKGVDGALCVDLVFLVGIQLKSRWGQLAHTKPDKDNLEKAVLDVMGDCGVFAVGDSQVAVGQTMKVWCDPRDAGVQVVLSRARVKQSAPAPGESEGDGVDWLAGGS